MYFAYGAKLQMKLYACIIYLYHATDPYRVLDLIENKSNLDMDECGVSGVHNSCSMSKKGLVVMSMRPLHDGSKYFGSQCFVRLFA